jgi:gluconokinase
VTVIVFGVTGAGKSHVGHLLAQQRGWTFYDADDFHSPASVEKMRRGIPLTDDDRRPWLDRLRQIIARSQAKRESIVLACSALKRSYRKHLAEGLDVTFVYLKANHALIAERLRQRPGHFMNPGLLNSQFATLEEPAEDEQAIEIDASAPPETILEQIPLRVQR